MKKLLFIFAVLSVVNSEMIFNSDGSTSTKIGNTYFYSMLCYCLCYSFAS